MMSDYIPGDVMHLGRFSLVQRAIERATGESVILKTCATEHPRASDIARVHNEWRILCEFESDLIVRAHALVEIAERPVLVLEDKGAPTLRALVGEPVDLAAFFALARQLGAALESVHAARVVHRDIKPENVLFDPASGVFALLDFNIAIRLSEHRAVAEPSELVAGTLPYLAPEQSGRTGRMVDERTDLYGIGVMFYELLSGRLPFEGESPLELIHQHLTATPPPLGSRAPRTPASVCAIVARLLAKNPDERYQSARGLRLDIERAERAWRDGDERTFALGEHDVSDRLRLPDELYGREYQLDALDEAGQRARRGAALMVCLRGAAGSGKSSLVRAFQRSFDTQGTNLMVSSRCDAMHRDVPHKPVIDALRQTLRRILVKDEDIIAAWTGRIRAAVGDNSAVLMDAVPELAVLMGSRPRVREVGTVEARNRFRDTLRALVQCFARPGHPLVLVIDDLQWADPATLTTLQSLLTDPMASDFLLIAAHRANDEVDALTLVDTLASWRESGIEIQDIDVLDLDPDEVARLLADVLRAPEDADLDALARVVHEKTHGNPFSVRQFVTALYRDGLLAFDPDAMHWTWDRAAIENADITDNVIELLVARMRALPAEVQQVLQWLACLGSHARADEILALASDIPLAEMAERISVALQHGLLATSSATERLLLSLAQRRDATLEPDEVERIDLEFTHDRVRQAAYALIPEAERARTHLDIGRVLYARMSADETLHEHLFDVAEHFRRGASLLPAADQDDRDERGHIIDLALWAARRARAATAYQTGLVYARLVTALLPSQPWTSHYEQAFTAGRIKAECLSLMGEYDAADALCRKLVKRARTVEEKFALHELGLQQCLATFALDKAIDLARAALALYDVSFPATDEDAGPLIGPELEAIARRLGQDPEAELLSLAETSEPRHVAVTSGLMAFFRIGYLSGRGGFATLGTLRAFSHTLEVGITRWSSYAVGMFGFFAMHFFDQWTLGMTVGRVGAKLAESNPSPAERALSEVAIFPLILHWHRPVAELPPMLEHTIANAHAAGAYEALGYGVSAWTQCAFLAGHELTSMLHVVDQHFVTLERVRAEAMAGWVAGVARGIATLTGAALEHMPPRTAMADEFGTDVATALRCALHLPRPAAEIDALMARRHLVFTHSAGLPFVWEVTFSGALHNLWRASAAAGDQTDPADTDADERIEELLQAARTDMATLQRWADGGNINLEHKIRLLEAEFARHEGRLMDALERYGEAMKQARAMDHPGDEALAAERAASLCEMRALSDLNRYYLSRARAAYDRWGARVKVRELDAMLGLPGKPSAAEAVSVQTATGRSASTLRSSSTARISSGLSQQRSTNTVSSNALDIESVVKAALAIGEEIRVSRLLESLMRVLMENAGADHAAVLMVNAGQLAIAAEARTADRVSVYDAQPVPLERWSDGPRTLVRYVMRARDIEVLGDATEHPNYGSDPYIQEHKVRSVVCLPIEKQGELMAVVYLENRAIPDAFTRENVALLEMLAGQIATSLENARLYRELEDALSDLASSERLKHEFLATISHELRTPLNAIINMPVVLLDAMPEPRGADDASVLPGIAAFEMRDMLETVYRSGQDLLSMIEGMILFTRLEAGILPFELIPLDVEEPILAVLDSLDTMAQEHRAVVEVDTSATSASRAQVLADPHLLQVIVHHLVENAIKFSPDGSTIHVRSRLVGTDIELSVRDPGPGIPPDKRTMIFESFRQASAGTKRARGGTGLGLTITKKLVDLHGGRIAVHSTPGEGSQFTVRLPAIILPPEPLTLH